MRGFTTSNGVAAVNGAGTTNEFLVNADFNPCANPVRGGRLGRRFHGGLGRARHGERRPTAGTFMRGHFPARASAARSVRVNTHIYGDQYAPRISAIGSDYLVVWTSLGQDGSREGVYRTICARRRRAGRRRISRQHHDGRLSRCSRWWRRTARISFWWSGPAFTGLPV